MSNPNHSILFTANDARALGATEGEAAGSWAIDGNTSADTARRIVEGFDEGDPEILDMAPSPLSGEFAGESIPEIFGGWPDDDVLDAYEEGFSEAFWNEVLSAARAIV